MKSVEFCYWLQGIFEVSKPKTFGIEETELIKKHLALVFKHEIDKSYLDQDALNKIHGAGSNSDGGDFLIRC